MSNLRLNWVLPVLRVGGGSLLPADIDFVEIKMSADGGDTFNGLVQAPPDTLEHVVTDVDPGTYSFIGVVQDIDGLRSDPVTITTDANPPVPGGAPMPLPVFTVVVE